MAKLSESERAMLKRLQEKEEAPDAPPVSKSVSATIDLSDDKQIAAAIKHGFLTADEADDLKDDDSSDNGDDKKSRSKGDATPRRRGSYFKEDDE